MSARRLRLVLSEQAVSDVRSIQRYTLEHWGAVQADEFDEAIDRALALLCAQPNLGRARDELIPGLRSFPVLSHTIYYRVIGDTLAVHRIVHQRRDAGRLLLP